MQRVEKFLDTKVMKCYFGMNAHSLMKVGYV